MKWTQRGWAPWVSLGAVLALGLFGFLVIGIVGAATAGTPASDVAAGIGIAWAILGFLVVPAAIALAIVWALRIRPTPDPAAVAQKRAASAASAAAKAERSAAEAADRTARKVARAERRDAVKVEVAARAEVLKAERAARVAAKPVKPPKPVQPPRQKTPRPSKPARVHEVQVSFLQGLEPKGWTTYTYAWPMAQSPEVGMYVIVNDNVPAMVMALGRGDYDGPVKPITRIATQKEISRWGRRGRVRFE